MQDMQMQLNNGPLLSSNMLCYLTKCEVVVRYLPSQLAWGYIVNDTNGMRSWYAQPQTRGEMRLIEIKSLVDLFASTATSLAG
jgi:hypothetical protein